MEVLGIVIVVVLVGMYYGMFDSIEEAAEMGNRKVQDLARDQKTAMVHKWKSKDMPSAADIKKAQDNAAAIDDWDI